MKPAIRVEGLSKTFERKRGNQPFLKLLRSWTRGTEDTTADFSALNDLSFSIPPGKKTALIGNNGAGKSTLLRIIGGLYRQSAGTVETNGTILYLPGLDIGMQPELSLTQNIILHSAIYGIPRKVSLRNIPDILAWAELEEFADLELRKLSKGMQARLAFSTCRHISADIHLLDEALSGGDRGFRAKCDLYFEQQTDNDTTYLVATHNLKFAEWFCTDALFLHKGRIVAFGPTPEVLDAYRNFEPGRKSGNAR